MRLFIAALAASACIGLSFTMPACGSQVEPGKDGVAAVVDGVPVTDTDVEAAAKTGPPEGALGRAIKLKALKTRAEKSGVASDPKYMEAVDAYADHMLVKTLLDRKLDEFTAAAEATDEEVANFADQMCYRISFLKNEFDTRKQADAFVARAGKSQVVKWEEEVDVLGCENVDYILMGELYRMEEGEIRTVARGRRYTVVMVTDKEKSVEPSELPDADEVRAYLIRRKAAAALDMWVDYVVDEADVKLPKPIAEGE